MAKAKITSNNDNTTRADQDIDITIYTDPLCCWSWAFEPQLEQIKSQLLGRASYRYRMGGLLPSWNNFHDEVNSVTRPVQMGPVWMHAGQVANKPIYHQLWMKDPPASSYPACIAVKCAQLQTELFGETLLTLLREACMIEGRNIAKQSVLAEVAQKLASTHRDFDLNKYNDDYANGNGMEAFRSDLELIRYYNINRFPTLIVKSSNDKTIIISGYRHYLEVLKAISAIVVGIEVPGL